MELIRVLDTTNFFIFEQIKSSLTELEIPFQFKNTMDSSFNNFGSYEIYVTSDFKTEVLKLIADVNG
jgi:hypothetical protein